MPGMRVKMRLDFAVPRMTVTPTDLSANEHRRPATLAAPLTVTVFTSYGSAAFNAICQIDPRCIFVRGNFLKAVPFAFRSTHAID